MNDEPKSAARVRWISWQEQAQTREPLGQIDAVVVQARLEQLVAVHGGLGLGATKGAASSNWRIRLLLRCRGYYIVIRRCCCNGRNVFGLFF